MSERIPHPSVGRATVEAVDGGWVSYVDPSKYPKASFGETKPYYAPKSLETLQGPDAGIIKLPIEIYWGPDRFFNLASRSGLRSAYRAIIEEADIEDQNRYLNRDVLCSVWDDLGLPSRVLHLWESNIKELYREG